MKLQQFATVLLIIFCCFPANAKDRDRNKDSLFQVSTLSALLDGEYDGRISFRQVEKHGNFGLGTFDALDGEMVALDGKFFQIRADGKARQVRPRRLTPFAAVTFFKPNDTFPVEIPGNCGELMDRIQSRLPSHDLLYAIKVTGRFATLQTRSVHAQEKPYVPLVEALSEQVVFNFDFVDATLVGFWLPEVLSELNAAGFHFHALTSDEQAGGHVLNCDVLNATVEIDFTDFLEVEFGTIKRKFKGKKRKNWDQFRHSKSRHMVPW